MTFATLYSTELDRALGSALTVLFTTERRKAAINAAQREWCLRTSCLTFDLSVSLVDETREYVLDDALANFAGVSAQGVHITITPATGSPRYLIGPNLRQTTIEALDAANPSWRAESSGTPREYYLRRDEGELTLGFVPAPNEPATETWVAVVHALADPADMTDDAHTPFHLTAATTRTRSLEAWHHALAFYAAADLEQYRKDVEREAINLAKWEQQVQAFLLGERPKQGQQVRFAVDYRARQVVRINPRV